MQRPCLQQITRDCAGPSSYLPFKLGSQTRARPTRKGVGLVIADVANRLVHRHRFRALDGVMPPLPVPLFPVQRSVPLVVANAVPPIGKPQLRSAVATVAHELQVLNVGCQSRSEPERLKVNVVGRALIVELKILAFETDPVHASRKRAPL